MDHSSHNSNSCLLLLCYYTTLPVTACIISCISCRTSPHPLITQQILTGGEFAYFPRRFHLPLDPTSVPTCAAFKLALCWFAGWLKSTQFFLCSACASFGKLCVTRPGACFTLVPKGFVAAGHWLPQNHTAYIKGKANKDVPGMQSIRVGFGSHPTKAELFLVPINAVQGTHLRASSTSACMRTLCSPQLTSCQADSSTVKHKHRLKLHPGPL